MHSSARGFRPRLLAFSGALVLVAGAVAFGALRPWMPLPASAPAGAGEGVEEIAPAQLVLPEHPRILVFGDSWTYGAAAEDPRQGYAYVLAELLDGETIVDGARGSGYIRPGSDGPPFGERISHLDPSLDPDLVVIQGSINDRLADRAELREAVVSAWNALSAKYPDAPIVVFGPAPHLLPVGTGTARIDADLAELAAARGWWYISPVRENWITPDNYEHVIDVGFGRRHPSTEGHRYLAEKLVAALDDLTAAAVTEAGGAGHEPQQ